MRRFSRGRAATDDEATPPATGTSEAAGDAASETRPAGGEPLPSNGAVDPVTEVTTPGTSAAEPATVAEPGTTLQPATGEAAATESEVPGRDLPAGVDLDELRDAPESSAGRGKLRRRVHYLRHVRELLLRDLGGFYAEAHRSEQGPDAHRRLLDAKAGRLATLDSEVRELEERLAEPHAETVLREPGIGGTCPECGELYGSGARFCSRCGAPLTGRAARERAGSRTQATGAGPATATSTSSGTTGAGTIGPATGAAAEEERMTTASLWGRRRIAAPAEPADATRAGDLTQAAPGEPAQDEAAAPRDEAAAPQDEAAAPDQAGDPPTRVERAAAEPPEPGAEERS
ncbi:MAG TPA: zinc-ribbon domain-containing protein [Solirubrobacteraceae bacterium]|nr:zinc-ribbon domain-containing protein [Solirubrobacteraceae bacterium]